MKRELLDKGNIWRKTDGRWIGMVRYRDEFGEMKRKSFSSKKKKDLQEKMTDFVINFQEQLINSDETRKPLRESMKNGSKSINIPKSSILPTIATNVQQRIRYIHTSGTSLWVISPRRT